MPNRAEREMNESVKGKSDLISVNCVSVLKWRHNTYILLHKKSVAMNGLEFNNTHTHTHLLSYPKTTLSTLFVML